MKQQLMDSTGASEKRPEETLVVIQPENVTIKVRDLAYEPRKEEESDGKVV